MSPFLGAAEEAIYNSYFAGTGIELPAGVLASLRLQACCTTKDKHGGHTDSKMGCLEPSKYPVVLLGAGLNTTRLFYSALAQEIASTGYTVITMDHPYETDVVEFPSDGSVIFGGNVVGDLNNTAPLIRALDIRSRDASFILDKLRIPFPDSSRKDAGKKAKVGMVGHSFGGAAAASAMLNDTRIVGGVNLDGYMFGPVLDTGVGRPGLHQSFLLWGSTGHNSSTDPSWGQFLETMKNKPAVEREWVKELSLSGSMHGSFGDYGVIADVAGWREDERLAPLVDAFAGPISGTRMMEISGKYLDAFMQMAVKGEREGRLLGGPVGEFPEVEFLS